MPALSVPVVVKTSFALVPFDNANGALGCPGHLLHTSEDGTASPIELVGGAFDLFEGADSQCVFPLFVVNFSVYSTAAQVDLQCIEV